MNAATCLVTGGAGFIGSHLVDALINAGHTVSVYDNLATGKRENVHSSATLHPGDIRDRAALQRAMAGCEWVFHAAALPRIQPSFDEPQDHEDVNVGGTINCLLAARDAGVKRLVYFGSSAVYGTPDEIPTTERAAIRCYNPYALQKFTAEQYCLILGERWGVPAVSLRLFNVFGPRSYNPDSPTSAYSPVIGIFQHLRRQGKPLTITGTGEQSRDFIHVHDVAAAFITAAESSVSGEVFNVGSGESHSINEIAEMMSDQHTYIPERPNEAAVTWADISRIREQLGWRPAISLEQGLQRLDD